MGTQLLQLCVTAPPVSKIGSATDIVCLVMIPLACDVDSIYPFWVILKRALGWR